MMVRKPPAPADCGRVACREGRCEMNIRRIYLTGLLCCCMSSPAALPALWGRRIRRRRRSRRRRRWWWSRGGGGVGGGGGGGWRHPREQAVAKSSSFIISQPASHPSFESDSQSSLGTFGRRTTRRGGSGVASSRPGNVSLPNGQNRPGTEADHPPTLPVVEQGPV